jgi:translation elongation factor EF-Tu-like GTPase
MENSQFYQALNRLMTDNDYRVAVEANPKQLVEDYQLSKDDLQMISSVGQRVTNEPDVQGYTWEEDVTEFFEAVDYYLCCC